MTADAQRPVAHRAGGPDHRRPLTWRDVRGDTRRRADELICTESEGVALKALRTATGEVDGDMERHTVRQYLIAERLADARGIAYDREVLLCASFLHDSGLYGPASSGDVYIMDSARYARRTLEPLGWPEERLRVCIDACEQHHALTSRWWMPNEVELVRRSDLVEVLPELARFGIPRSWLKRELWQAVPRAGFWPALLAIFGRTGGGCCRACLGRRYPDARRLWADDNDEVGAPGRYWFRPADPPIRLRSRTMIG